MIIDCVSDLHGCFPKLEGGDLLIVAGDCISNDSFKAWGDFFAWFKKQKYRKKILIAGNHDNYLSDCFPKTKEEAESAKEVQAILEAYGEELPDFDYLCDSGTEFEGLKIWGSPWSLWFYGINPDCKAFTCTETEIRKKWLMIPRDIDILITHSPPNGILDGIKDKFNGGFDHVGSRSLRDLVLDGSYLHNLKLHVFGHIHEHGGNSLDTAICTFVNASIMDENYVHENKPVRVFLDEALFG